MAWRTRVAPWERRMVAYGQVESVWPTVGTVLIHDGLAYACAGRTSESDGGIALVALDPLTGTQRWGTSISQGSPRMNDMLAVRDGQIAWYNLRLDAKTGQTLPAATFPKDPSQGGMLDGTWTTFKFRRSGNGFVAGKVVANILAWNERSIVSGTAAVTREQEGKTPDKSSGACPNPAAGKTNEVVESGAQKPWTTPFASSQRAEAIALAPNAAVFAGRTVDPQGKFAGFLSVLAAADGQQLSQFSLASPPTFDGLAIAQQRVFVSLQDGSLVCFGAAE
jgi:outer membrane protein assembly factor BamB